eukprot:TRINITY_DN4512_c0_g1_i1.p1 TRINITY_DN4512_c0_g1~~TRINITY_DN4512_c0_g1_i1.p1  ORF type:complete len:524 (-),score=132.06 TRINITY_DN4512_c0_g1_i1:172-1743(-)
MESNRTAAVAFASLTKWSAAQQISNPLQENDVVGDSSRLSKPSKFPVASAMNEKIILWRGDITHLDTDAIVSTTNESMTDRNGVSGAIHEAAGPELATECLKLEGCRTGDAKITKGYKLHARHVIHTVGPRYNEKYRTAAENALHNCYRNSLQILKENKLTTIAFCVVNSEKRGYPLDVGAHIAIRTVRRFLEHYGSEIELIVFAMPTDRDYDMYAKVLPLYFPRSEDEETKAKGLLPEDTGNEFGETVVAERMIRVSEGPIRKKEVTKQPSEVAVAAPTPAAPATTPTAPTAATPSPVSYDFVSMQSDPDKAKLMSLQTRSKEELDDEEAEKRFIRLYRKARQEDLSDLAAMKFIYQSGTDLSGRPILVIVSRHLQANMVDLNRVHMYIYLILEPLLRREFTVLYVHTESTSDNQPEFSWLKEIYDLLPNSLRRNMKRMYVLHPTFLLKTFFLFLSPFLSESFWEKLSYVDNLTELFKYIDPKGTSIPSFVIDYDKRENGFDPNASSHSSSSSSAMAPHSDL